MSLSRGKREMRWNADDPTGIHTNPGEGRYGCEMSAVMSFTAPSEFVGMKSLTRTLNSPFGFF
jgi:hypothetical protein